MEELELQLHQEMLDMYQLAGKETGYWGNYFLRSVRNNGGLKTARRMLSKKLENPSEQKGFQSLIEAGRPDLSLENVVLQSKYKPLFTDDELIEAKRRLDLVPSFAVRKKVKPEFIYPEDLIEEEEYIEGAKKQITVNAYERSSKARQACIKKYGYRCQVCSMKFSEAYGKIGERFIHVHHKKQLAGRRTSYKVNPTIDLEPVCPNCHAMLHTSDPPLGIEELKEIMLDVQNKKEVK